MHALFAVSLFAFSTGWASVALLLLLLRSTGSREVTLFLSFTVTLLLYLLCRLAQAYGLTTGLGFITLIVRNYLLITALGVTLFSLFQAGQIVLRRRPLRLYRVLIGASIFLSPHLLFSSSTVREELRRIDSVEIFSLLVAASLIFAALFIARWVKSGGFVRTFSRWRGAPPLLVGTILLAAGGILMPLTLGKGEEPGWALLTMGPVSLFFLATVVTLTSPSGPWTHRSVPYTLQGGLLDRYGISPREREIVALVAEGRSNGEIAQALFISETTVKTHLYRIFRKTGVTSRLRLLSLLGR